MCLSTPAAVDQALLKLPGLFTEAGGELIASAAPFLCQWVAKMGQCHLVVNSIESRGGEAAAFHIPAEQLCWPAPHSQNHQEC